MGTCRSKKSKNSSKHNHIDNTCDYFQKVKGEIKKFEKLKKRYDEESSSNKRLSDLSKDYNKLISFVNDLKVYVLNTKDSYNSYISSLSQSDKSILTLSNIMKFD